MPSEMGKCSCWSRQASSHQATHHSTSKQLSYVKRNVVFPCWGQWHVGQFCRLRLLHLAHLHLVRVEVDDCEDLVFGPRLKAALPIAVIKREEVIEDGISGRELDRFVELPSPPMHMRHQDGIIRWSASPPHQQSVSQTFWSHAHPNTNRPFLGVLLLYS